MTTTYDATLFTGKPKAGIPGTVRCAMIYGFEHGERGWFPDAEHAAVKALPQIDRPLPDEARAKRLVKAIGNRRDPLLIHLEEYTVGDDGDHAGHEHEYRAYGQVARWCREADPRRLIGLCGGSPHGGNAAARKKGAGLQFAQNLRLWREHVAPHVDLVADLYYVFAATDMAEWREWFDYRTKAIAALCKRQVPMFNADSPDPDKLAEAVGHARGRGFDVSMWSHAVPWDARAAWRGLLTTD